MMSQPPLAKFLTIPSYRIDTTTVCGVNSQHHTHSPRKGTHMTAKKSVKSSVKVNDVLETICTCQEAIEASKAEIMRQSELLAEVIELASYDSGVFESGDFNVTVDSAYTCLPYLRYKVSRRKQLPVVLNIESKATHQESVASDASDL